MTDKLAKIIFPYLEKIANNPDHERFLSEPQFDDLERQPHFKHAFWMSQITPDDDSTEEQILEAARNALKDIAKAQYMKMVNALYDGLNVSILERVKYKWDWTAAEFANNVIEDFLNFEIEPNGVYWFELAKDEIAEKMREERLAAFEKAFDHAVAFAI